MITNNEMIKIWLTDLYKAAIDDATDTVANEQLWEKGYTGEAPNPHTENIKNLREYIEVLGDLIAEI